MRLLRRLIYALFIAGFASPVMAQGTIPVALTQQINQNGQPLSGALLYTYVAGTVATPQSTYQDTALTILNPFPLTADITGRIPMFYMANGSTHARLTDSTGVVQFDYPNMLVIGPSGGSSSGGTVDPTTVLATGDLKVKYGTGTLTGFVRANGLTIGSAVSGGTERANADTQNLFVYLYGADPNLTVSGGRTGNALNDFNANKTIALPDWRGQAIGALADMGNTATSLLTSTYFGTSPTVLGAAGGLQNTTLTLAQLPTGITSSATVVSPNNTYLNAPATGFGVTSFSANAGSQVWQAFSSGAVVNQVTNITSTGSATSNNTSGQSFPSVSPMKLATIYVKL